MGSGAAFEVFGDLERTKKRRSKRTAFDKNLHYYKDDGVKIEFPKVPEAQLNIIRRKLKKQQRSERNRTILAFILAIPVFIFLMISFFYFVEFLRT